VRVQPVVSEQWAGGVTINHEVDFGHVEVYEQPEGEYHKLIVVREAAELLGQQVSPGLMK
jgi:hypothetical protein